MAPQITAQLHERWGKASLLIPTKRCEIRFPPFNNSPKAAVNVGVVILLVATGPRLPHAAAEPAQSISPTWRQPVGLWLSPDERWLCVANQTESTLVVLDTQSRKVVARQHLGGRLESLAGSPDGWLAAPDSENNRLHLVRLSEGRISGDRILSTGRQPMHVVLNRDGTRAWVSVRVDRAVEAYDADTQRRVYRRALRFEPHCLALSPDESCLLVADAFRGNMAALAPATGDVLRQFEFTGSNIRGLAFSPDGSSFVFAQQIFSEQTMITRDAVFWGAFMTNNVRRVKLTTFLDPHANPLLESRLYYLGDPGHGSGDPGNLAVGADGTIVVCLSGVDEIAISREWSHSFRREAVGRRPVAVVLGPTTNKGYVTNRYDDTVSVFELKSATMAEPITLGPPATLTAAMRGEILFHNARLSLDGWYSCQSCHTDGHTNGMNADTLGDRTFGAPKNTPSLLGVTETGPWAWTGRFETLEEQIDSSVRHTMQGSRLGVGDRADLIAYLQTLAPPKRDPARDARIQRGQTVFESRRCVNCHKPQKFTTSDVYDVGLNDGLGGNTMFNPPSLRSVSRSAPYLHDGRAKSLRDVLTSYRHELDEPLSEPELEELLAYLESL
jgi:DNA-binding beta-propeller fold protein YncE/mono/diheme cytochrome c family protein